MFVYLHACAGTNQLLLTHGPVRARPFRYLTEQGIEYCFWSANAETKRQEEAKQQLALEEAMRALYEGDDDDEEEDETDSGLEEGGMSLRYLFSVLIFSELLEFRFVSLSA